jgi:N-acetylmuramoyl-L-alanine amidase
MNPQLKRLLPILSLSLVAALLLGQSTNPSQATLRTPAGDKQVAVTHQGNQTLFSAEDVVTALGGTVTKDANGWKVTVNNVTAVFGTDSRFAVVREDLIEMPLAPLSVEGRAFVPWQFFNGFLSRASDQEAAFDPVNRVLSVRPLQRSVVSVQFSVADVQGISKIVLTLSGQVDYAIVKEAGAYTVHFKTPVKAPFTEQTFEDPYVAKAGFTGNDLHIQLTSPDVVGDAYRLDNPFRIVLDLRKGAAPAPGVVPPSVVTKPVEQPGIHTIVIDPGHGGTQVGAIGPAGLLEKDATMALCRKLADALSAKLHARVILTRTDDSLVSLDQRTAVANQYKADLFLSVHMNAAVVKGAKGSETYFLSLEASDELAKRAAEVENATPRAPGAPAGASDGDLKLILWDLAQQSYLNESSRFAQDVQEEMNRISGITNRGVKQAPFKVLVGATMPAALVEVAFITNPDEEARIKSESFQNTVVGALTTAVERYKTDYETRIGLIQPVPPPTTTAPTSTAPTTTAPTTTAPTTTAPTTTAPTSTATAAPAKAPAPTTTTTAPVKAPAPASTTAAPPAPTSRTKP